ncbi:MAG: hypothetical protein AUG04_07085 [Deltaproteobacteria bacterium 13_1_20CM_2_69_21]|nr:MAG: hypothetical protein AUH83_12665 [Deltaproteobacteria bacterium 13_1_40CM_4_68_19]OLD09617.1 MAG: hypothetical protein AUI90_03630 [Deltaproteobacteria bacterium 13_1_40CM_3_69_14]OLD47530.1 MAG: hypothetical protein AUI48_03325 [Chloroflexi bacterium 13_1_40CM_2_68_14]OLE63034.1 MAG: hypothetical protein AUG04_07085 [Deltaproteobacteria bacterium 13_1_20CM_2_69_21]
MPRPWTVLPHQPIEKLQENLWTVEATLPQGPLRRRMGIARLGDGQLVFLNAIALDEPSMKRIEAWGKPAFALTANGFHRLDLGSYKARYPGLRVLAAPAARKRIGQIATVDGWLELLPADPSVSIEEVAGAKMGDVACTAHAARRSSLCFPGDVLMNVAPVRGFPGLLLYLLGFIGELRVPRLIRWIGVKDRKSAQGASAAPRGHAWPAARVHLSRPGDFRRSVRCDTARRAGPLTASSVTRTRYPRLGLIR